MFLFMKNDSQHCENVGTIFRKSSKYEWYEWQSGERMCEMKRGFPVFRTLMLTHPYRRWQFSNRIMILRWFIEQRHDGAINSQREARKWISTENVNHIKWW